MIARELPTLAHLDLPERKSALADFYARWQHEALVVDKWLRCRRRRVGPAGLRAYVP